MPWLVLSSLLAASDPSLSEWLKARGAEHETYLRGEASAAHGQLWRPRPAEDKLPEFSPLPSLAPLIRAVRPGVVHVTVTAKATGRRSLGSGFLISADGFVVTNHHVVDREGVIKVRLQDGREFTADAVGRDASTDVALLRLRSDSRDLPYCYLGDSDVLEVGDWVVAIGNPFGLDHSVSHGMISAKERVIGVGAFDDFLQTDASINPGNSGGPLFNFRGEVVGVNTAIVAQGQGIGFAVPANLLKDLLPQLRENGKLERGWLGVNIVQGEVEATRPGAVVKDVYKGSPAEKAGIRPGDRVLSVNGRPIESYLKLLRRIALVPPGTELTLTVERAGKASDKRVALVERPAQGTMERLVPTESSDALGLSVQDLDAATAAQLGVGIKEGVLVSAVYPGSPAERAGVAPGDLITEVNRTPVSTARGYQAALGEKTDGGSLLRIQRGDVVRYVALKVASAGPP